MDLEVSVSTTRQPIFEVNGRKFFYQGKTNGDHVWQAESSPEQLVILALIGLEKMVVAKAKGKAKGASVGASKKADDSCTTTEPESAGSNVAPQAPYSLDSDI